MYTIPAGDSVNAELGSGYSPPSGDSVNVDFQEIVGQSVVAHAFQEQTTHCKIGFNTVSIQAHARQEQTAHAKAAYFVTYLQTHAFQEQTAHCKIGFAQISLQAHASQEQAARCRASVFAVYTIAHTFQEQSAHGKISFKAYSVKAHASQEQAAHCKITFAQLSAKAHALQEQTAHCNLQFYSFRAHALQEQFARAKVSFQYPTDIVAHALQEQTAHCKASFFRLDVRAHARQEQTARCNASLTIYLVIAHTVQEQTAHCKASLRIIDVKAHASQEQKARCRISFDQPPQFLSTPPKLATYPFLYRYPIVAYDREGYATVSPVSMPSWLHFDNNTLSGIPPDPLHAEPLYYILMQVVDSNGYFTIQEWGVRVLSIYENPLPNDSLLNWLRTSSKGKVVTVHMRGYNLLTNTVQDFYYATEPFISKPTDTPPNRPFLEYILDVPIIESSCSVDFAGSDATWGNISLFIGALSRANLIGGYAFDLRDLIIKIGNKYWAYNQFYTLFAGCVAAAGLSVDGTSIHIPLRNNAALLNKKLLDSSVINSIYPEFLDDGITAHPAAKQLKQEVWGGTHLHPVFNVKATLINPGEMQYQVHNGKIAEIVEVRDKGVPVLFDADLEAGTFKLTQGGAQDIRCDIVGGMIQVAGIWSQPNTAADIARALALRVGITSEQILESSLQQLNGSDPSVIGIVVTDEATVTDLAKKILSSVNAIHEFDPDGKLIVRKLVAPKAAYEDEQGAYKPLYVLTDDGLDQNGVEIERILPPAKSTTLRYRKNWGEQTQVADSIVEEHPELQQLYKLPFSDVVSINSTNPDIAAFLSAEAADKVETYLTRQSDAQYYADIRMGLRAYPRMLVKAKVLSDIGTALRNGDHIAFSTANNDYGVNNKRWVIVRVAPSPLAGETNIQALEIQSE